MCMLCAGPGKCTFLARLPFVKWHAGHAGSAAAGLQPSPAPARQARIVMHKWQVAAGRWHVMVLAITAQSGHESMHVFSSCQAVQF